MRRPAPTAACTPSANQARPVPGGAYYNPPMPTLILALPLTRCTAATEFDFVLSSEAGLLLEHGTAPLVLLPACDRVVLVAPVQALSWHRVQVPPVPASRLRAALAGLLEEQLLDDTAQLAFARVPGRADDGQALIVVFDKAWLQAALELFEQSRRPVSQVVPALAPQDPGDQSVQLHVTGSADDARLTVVDAQGVTSLPLVSAPGPGFARLAEGVQEDAAAARRFLMSAQAVLSDHDLMQGEVFAEPAVAGLAEQALGRAVTVQLAPQRLLQASRCRWDLAQFDLSISGGGRRARRWRQHVQQLLGAPAWRPARWGLLALLLVHLVGINAWAWKLDAVVRDKQQRVNALLTQTFPGVRTVVDAPLQMQRELALLRQSRGGVTADDLEVMLAALGGAMPVDAAPAAIEYASGELAVRGLALAGPQRELLQDKLHAQGYQVRADGGRLVVRQQGRP